MTHWEMYWFTRLDFITDLGVAGMAIIIVFSFTWGFISYAENDIDTFKQWIKPLLVIWCMFTALAFFTPSQKEVAAIWLVPKIINSEQINNITTNTLTILERYTKEYISDLVGTVNE